MSQVWLVTGSSRGLGRAIVEAGLLAGNKVLATARDIGSLRELSERYGEQVKLFALDVTDESSAALRSGLQSMRLALWMLLSTTQDMAIFRPSKIRLCRISAPRSKRICSGQSS